MLARHRISRSRIGLLVLAALVVAPFTPTVLPGSACLDRLSLVSGSGPCGVQSSGCCCQFRNTFASCACPQQGERPVPSPEPRTTQMGPLKWVAAGATQPTIVFPPDVMPFLATNVGFTVVSRPCSQSLLCVWQI